MSRERLRIRSLFLSLSLSLCLPATNSPQERVDAVKGLLIEQRQRVGVADVVERACFLLLLKEEERFHRRRRRRELEEKERAKKKRSNCLASRDEERSLSTALRLNDNALSSHAKKTTNARPEGYNFQSSKVAMTWLSSSTSETETLSPNFLTVNKLVQLLFFEPGHVHEVGAAQRQLAARVAEVRGPVREHEIVLHVSVLGNRAV
jgi:hypothetical protein